MSWCGKRSYEPKWAVTSATNFLYVGRPPIHPLYEKIKFNSHSANKVPPIKMRYSGSGSA